MKEKGGHRVYDEPSYMFIWFLEYLKNSYEETLRRGIFGKLWTTY